jgi:hypothetical protein
MPSLMDMEKKSVIIGGITGSIVGLFLLVLAAIAVSSASASNYNCIDIGRLGQKLERRVAWTVQATGNAGAANIFQAFAQCFSLVP